MAAITRSGRYYLTAFGLAFLAGLALGNFTYLLSGLLLLGFLLFGIRQGYPRSVVIERETSTARCTVGDIVTVRVEARIRKGVGFLLLHDKLPGVFDLVDGNNTHLVWKGAGERRVQYEYRMKCTKRGGFSLAGTVAHGVNPLGLVASRPVAAAEDHELIVEPRILKVRQVKHMRGKAVSIFPSGDRARLGTLTNEFSEIRDYQRGDPLKSVNWKATAKASTEDLLTLMVNEYEVEGKKAVWFFIDAADYMEVGSTLTNTFDQTVEAALELLEHFIGRGFRVGGTVYNSAGGAHEAPLFYPDHGRSQFLKVVKVLTGITTSSAHEGLPAAVERCRGFLARERPMVLLVTRPEGDFERTVHGVKRLMSYATTGRHRSPIMLLAPQVRTAARESQDISDLALLVAEEEAHSMNKKLRRMGVSLVEWDPQHSPVAAVLARGVRTR
ncbi:MAG: DUF58 domain-containing protein [Euryarchaeota archaeon]|nr:DUF58 domain-containing protein [Euryarchaeota archaeon]